MTDHPYNDPRLMPKSFLEAVMHDPALPIFRRIEAAKALLDVYYHCYREPAIVYRIQGLGNEWPDNGPQVQVSVSITHDHEAKDHRPEVIGHA